MAFIEECIDIIQKKLPEKLKDPGSFTISMTIGNKLYESSLFDLGSNINMMSLSIFKRLYIGEVQPIIIILQLTDISFTYPRGLIKDVLINVDKFIY
ncbi:hypothetical protein MA16_Dca009969 [Dendrobium catenatum]|uniref:Aspartic peptidase DDI1-type domain-containing protein n=1 Tax=Dendrobium catenatum TaxID=906689 RepID=A0A2I0WDF3_9ASPA|nr:hypothetical protein MA16_Dca009969 [Dendrobium catenatum]